MVDYSTLNAKELDELVSIGLVNIVALLIDCDFEREDFRADLVQINTAVAELTLRAGKKGRKNEEG